MEISTMSNDQLRDEISFWQDVQKASRPGLADWEAASKKLHPMFEEMCRRQNAGEL